MAKQVINIGRTANDRSGDPLRTAFNKVNENFTELYNTLGGTASLGDFSITSRTIASTTQGNVILRALGPSGSPSDPPLEYNWLFTSGGRLSMPAGGDIVDSNGVSVLSNRIVSTVAPPPGTEEVGEVTAITVTNSPNPNWTSDTGVFANGINFVVSVDGAGNATVSTINDGGTGHYIGETFGPVLGSAFGGTDVVDDMYFQVTAIAAANYAALDLTKAVQKLSDGSYSLGNGVEGQLMYFVRTTGSTGIIRIHVTNTCRINGVEYTNNFLDLGSNDIVTFLYTDSAWQAVGGLWD